MCSCCHFAWLGAGSIIVCRVYVLRMCWNADGGLQVAEALQECIAVGIRSSEERRMATALVQFKGRFGPRFAATGCREVEQLEPMPLQMTEAAGKGRLTSTARRSLELKSETGMSGIVEPRQRRSCLPAPVERWEVVHTVSPGRQGSRTAAAARALAALARSCSMSR